MTRSPTSMPLSWHGLGLCLTLALLATLCGLLQLAAASGDYPGVIELVGYSNRRARTHYMPNAGRSLSDTPTMAPPPAKTQADIETVKQNIEKYNKLLTLDTRNLPESQKEMLERIVERVARLKESLDIDGEQTGADRRRIDADKNTSSSSSGDEVATTPSNGPDTTDATTVIETDTDPTLVLDETTLLKLQSSMDELAAAQAAVTAQTTRMRELSPSTTEIIGHETTADMAIAAEADAEAETDAAVVEAGSAATSAGVTADYELPSTTVDSLSDATDEDDQFVAARSNNNIAAITAADPGMTLSTTAGNQRTLTTSGKLTKTRATKRPSSSSATKATSQSKRGQRPGSSTASLHKQTTLATKQKLAAASTITTTLPLQYQQQHQYKVSSMAEKKAAAAAATTPAAEQRPTLTGNISGGGGGSGNPSGSTALTYSSSTANTNTNNNDMVYDAHVNTSAIIDSLNQAREEFYQQKQTVTGGNKDKKPSTATAKPTKYHYYPHNQHIYLLPECAIQQVCNAVYVRLNYTQPLCACPSRYRDPCSASLNEDDQHTTKLVGDGKKKAITLAKTCEATTEMRECRSPKDWSLLALQNTRTGKSHYLVICRCPDHFKMEGPMAHDQPTYASVPGIRVFGMMCVKAGYSVRKPSSQPPKRYQLQKPFYRPSNGQSSYLSGGANGGNSQYLASSSNVGGSNKDNYGRPMSSIGSGSNYHQEDSAYSHQHQSHPHQSSYQYLNRPESGQSGNVLAGNYRPESLPPLNSFQSGIYGRTNERNGNAPIESAPADENTDHHEHDTKVLISSSTTQPLAKTDEAAAPASAPAAAVSTLTSTSNEHQSSGSFEMDTNAEAADAEAHTGGKRKRSIVEIIGEFEEDNAPEFPWDRVLEFQQSIIWD